MHVAFNPKHNLEVVEIYPGEWHATRASCIISTVPGSCVSVALHDSAAGVAEAVLHVGCPRTPQAHLRSGGGARGGIVLF